MSYASQAGRARTNPAAPDAHAICDRCGFRYNFRDLSFQFDWRGPTLKNLYILVCDECLDTPQEQLRSIVLPADPVPIIYARPELYAADSIDYLGTGQTTTSYPQGIPVISQEVLGGVTTTNAIVPQPVGPAMRGATVPTMIGLDPKAQMPLVKAVDWATEIPVLSISSNGTSLVTITCSAPHNLSQGAQFAVWGVTNPLAYGFFNAIVATATVFRYEVNANIAPSTLNTGTTKCITTNAGAPWGFQGP